MIDIKSLGESLGITFRNQALIEQAFIHRSYLNENKSFLESNERLEFLGDAVIELITTEYLYQNYTHFQEGMLTNLRASLVRTDSLASIAKTLNLDSILRMSKGEEASGGRDNKSLLADTFEAFIGALYLDQGMENCRRLLEKHLFPKLAGILEKGAYKDSKSALQEVSQSLLKETPKYHLLSEAGPDHDKQFVMQVVIGDTKYARGEGRSKQEAQEEAAQKTLEILQG